MVLTKKKYSWYAEYFLYFVRKKSKFFSKRGVEPPPLPDSMSAKIYFFLDALPYLTLNIPELPWSD